MAPKMHNLLGGTSKELIKSKDTQNKKTKPTKTIQDKKKEKNNIQQLSTLSQTAEIKKKRGRPPKVTEKPIVNEQEPKKFKSHKPTITQIPETSTRNTYSQTTTTITEWISSKQLQPEEFRPIIFNTLKKQLVTGYKVGQGYAMSTAYEVDRFKKKFGYIEWKYNPICSSLNMCPKKFPDCTTCTRFKKGT